jgi:hypothetical protein
MAFCNYIKDWVIQGVPLIAGENTAQRAALSTAMQQRRRSPMRSPATENTLYYYFTVPQNSQG